MKCGYGHSLFAPLTLIFVGVAVLMVNLGVLPNDIWRFWPIILVVIGLVGLSGLADGSNEKSSTKKTKLSR